MHLRPFQGQLTTGIVAGSQENTTGCLSLPDKVASSRSTQDAILANEQLLDTVGSADLGDLLDNLRVEIATITTDDEESTFSTFRDGEKHTSDEGFGVVGLLEDGDLLTKT